jgi:predicted ATP-dependent serine protease
MTNPLNELLNKLETERNYLDEQINSIKAAQNKEIITIETASQLEARIKSKTPRPKIMTGISVIDSNTGGFEFGTFINIAGEAGAGKTTLLLKILTNLAEGHKVLFFSFEMYEDRLIRFIRKLTYNYLSYENLLIEQTHRDIRDIERIIEQQSETVKVFVIDSIMKLESSGEGINEKRSNISSVLAKLTQRLGIIIILINQVSKADLKEGRVDFKGSGDVAYDSDINFFINVKRNKATDEITDRKLICAKNRDGNYFSGLIPDFFPSEQEYKE